MSRLSLGVAALDEMLGGGLPRGYSLLVAGPSGSGKSILAGAFLLEGARCGEIGVIAAFEQRPTHSRSAAIADLISEGRIAVVDTGSMSLSVDEVAGVLLAEIRRTGATRVVIDSLSGFELALAPTFRKDFRESLARMMSALAVSGATVFMTSELEDRYTELRFSPYGTAFLTDAIIVQRYIEIDSRLQRVMAVVKVRGSSHSDALRTFRIDDNGIHVGDMLPDHHGLLGGSRNVARSGRCRRIGSEWIPAMTERRRDANDEATVAARPVAEADEVRAELARLHAELAALQAEYDANAMARLREANEKLLLASLRAERIADIALRLGQRARARPRSRRSGDEPPWQDLRDANEALLVAALDERRHSSAVEDVHQRQVRYLAMVAHELRNPLSPIRSAAALLTRAGDDPAMLHRVQGVIARQVGHMARLVEDLLDGARVASGSFRVEHGSVDLGEVLAQAVETCESAIEQRRQHLALDVPVGPVMIRGDAGRLAQVFGNLLDNASKYTPEGGDIELSVTVADAWVRVRVADSGIGISGSGLERVFDLFAREDHALEQDFRGLGIGLSVVRGLVEAHGGRIVARSNGLGHGSEFEVMLPIDGTGVATADAVVR
jgi:signal transduction histidine kinase/KaiC/GvpD/RAD55 family RecA-like ATPase